MSNRISVVVVSGSLERLQMAGMVASVGAVSGNEVKVFLSMNALAPFRKGAASQAPAEGEFGKLLARKKVPPFKQLFESAVDAGRCQGLSLLDGDGRARLRHRRTSSPTSASRWA